MALQPFKTSRERGKCGGGADERHRGLQEETENVPVLKVPRLCPLILLVGYV